MSKHYKHSLTAILQLLKAGCDDYNLSCNNVVLTFEYRCKFNSKFSVTSYILQCNANAVQEVVEQRTVYLLSRS